MLNSSFAKAPFYGQLCTEIDPRRLGRRQPLFARGCQNWWLGRYFFLFQKESMLQPGLLCTVIIKEAGFISTGICYIANTIECAIGEASDRFDSYENIRENAADSYHEAMAKGDIDEAARQATIAKEAQLKKEGIYSIQYTPMPLDKRSGL